MANYSVDTGGQIANGISINDSRRVFDFGNRVAELAPQQSPFFVYLSKVAKKTTDDPVFKFLEQRHQWQRRSFDVEGAVTWTTHASTANVLAAAEADNLVLDCGYNNYGNIEALCAPQFLLKGQVVAVEFSDGVVRRFKIDVDPVSSGTDGTDGISTITITAGAGVTLVGDNWSLDTDYTMSDDAKGQVIGSAWAEGSKAPDGWEDALYDNEGYCQIFKTAMNLFSGTAMATEYRGIANEYKRIWTDKLMEHKMDLEQATLFGIGSANESAGSAPTRYTHGIVPYTEANGKVYNFSYASSGYDAFLDAMEDFFAPESGNSGNKLVLASRKVITYLNKLGSGSFLNNTVGSSQYSLNVTSIPGAFGHQVTVVDTIFGKLHFVAEPLLRGPWEDYCAAVDMKNVAYRPLSGNGISRDTFVETNIQDNDEDGRRDQIITEAGLEISLPETHAILKFS